MNIMPPSLEDDPADVADVKAQCVSPLRELNLRDAGVSTVIWATGFTGDFSWIHLPVFDEQNQPVHKRGVNEEHGLNFVGFPWLNSRKSGIIYGFNEDVQYIVNAIREQLA